MRSVITIQARNSLRIAAKWRYRAPPGVRWSSSKGRKWSTPLAKQLSEAITATGPIPLASFMRMCLTSDVGGYYTSKQEGRDQFGQKGDFITSPEISQIFGELIGIWFVAEWMAQEKRRKGVELIEIGPGRGTLMDDMLRTIRNFKPMASSIEAVYLVEASPALREAQKQLLCGDAPMTETSIGYRSISKYANIPIIWTENIRFVPSDQDKTPFIVAHEFFDALPIHAFESIPAPPPPPAQTSTIETPTGSHPLTPSAAASRKAQKQPVGPQWREMVVSPTPPSPINTTTLKDSSEPPPEFHLTLSKHATPHSMYLPHLSSRYASVLKTSPPGSLIEISPESRAYASAIASLIGGSKDRPKLKPSGAALILDYGPADTIPINSLRGIREHKIVSPFSKPGLTDLSVDVDFVGLAEAATEGSEGVEVWGPVEQGSFLSEMGIKERAEMLLKALNDGKRGGDDEVKKRVLSAWERLVERGGGGMGRVYKVLAVLPETGGSRKPVGFGGDVGV
ncbi:putative S-adenosyl-L-methionine-dependent methyltransferase-domain-containing protein [Tricladium varicosporioides]|nr:putative S-adenosyl-L-methionine-dependent methyltransferase-domain-containing protein [Hymenoscyphus varicosporioides]